MKRAMTRLVLLGSGVTLGLIGAAMMAAPVAFLEMSHVYVEQDPGLMSELTAPAGVLILSSTLLLLGAFKLRLADLALLTGAMVYGSYGLGRLVSMVLHGLPSVSLIAATIVELVVAVLLCVLWTWSRRDKARSETRAHTQALNA